jgi:DNA repair protein RadC
MSTQLTLIETSDFEADRIVQENQLIDEVLFHGSIDGASVYPRQVVKRSLAHNAAAAILVHNHPSGCTEPSQADRVLTARLKEALALIEVRVLDHFIVGEGRPLSLAEYGWL